jgi:hypothetical protein
VRRPSHLGHSLRRTSRCPRNRGQSRHQPAALDDVAKLREWLVPYRGRFVAAGGGSGNFLGPVDLALGRCSITNPARYQAGPHEAVVGLSEAIRTVTIKAPTGCTVDAGDTWRVYNGYFSAAGTFNAEEAAAGKDTDRVSVEVPTSNAVAGDEIRSS